MENQELYKQAILDAKAVRETAMAAAKESLAEAFEPRIKEMLRLKLSEELEEAEDDTMEEAEDKMEEMKHSKMEESTLDEILAELDAMSEEPGKHEMEEDLVGEASILTDPNFIGGLAAILGVGGSYAAAILKDLKSAKTPEEKKQVLQQAANSISRIAGGNDAENLREADEMGEEGEEATDDEKVVELTVGELKDLFRDVFAQVQGGDAEMMAGAEEEGELGIPGEEEGEEMKEISLDEILAELEEEDKKMEEAVADYKGGKQDPLEEKKKMEEKKKVEKELEEARKAVKTMRAELQEANLLNAKLLYVNKLLKAKPLTEAQKIKVLNAFDRATTVKETENLYKTLNESLITTTNKRQLKESFGYASKPAGSAPAKPIVEVDSMVARWQQIAGITK